MSEWQPARYKQLHPDESCDAANVRALEREIIRVRLSEICDKEISEYRELACDALRFYEVHPEDQIRLFGSVTTTIICEHEILTD